MAKYVLVRSVPFLNVNIDIDLMLRVSSNLAGLALIDILSDIPKVSH